jgi:N-terminal acetyltransferase B complex catalytic subunit
MGIGAMLTERLEKECNKQKALFVDLFVRQSNEGAIKMYTRLGYSVFRVVQGYYPGVRNEDESEDALDMRKLMDAGEGQPHVREDGRMHVVQPWDLW